LKDYEQLFTQIADEYSLMLLNWAYKKLGDREKAEDLAQEVLVQVFSTIKKDIKAGKQVEKLENLVWKVAHYVWCHHLRRLKTYRMYVPVDELQISSDSDFVAEYAEKEHEKQLILRMRKQIARLSFLQREIMISFYLDKLTVKQIAEKLNISEQAVKWHLFDTRKKLRREIIAMKNTDYVYRPRKLHMAISGQSYSYADTDVINNSLTKQNICVACYDQPRTLDELNEILGIPKAYLEYDLQWLIEREFVTEEKEKYSTSFAIETAQSEQEKNAIYLKHKEKLSDVIINELFSSEDKLRKIGFCGSDKPMEKLLWLLIYQCAGYIRVPFTLDPPIRPDGGRYYPLGFDRTDFDKIEKVVDTSGWACNGSIYNGNFWWFGLYNFGQSEIQYLIGGSLPEWQQLRELLCRIVDNKYDVSTLNENDRFNLAKLVEKGFVTIDGRKALPNFCIFSPEQHKQLEQSVFEPIVSKIADAIQNLQDDLSNYYDKTIPKHLKSYKPLLMRLAINDLGYLTTIFAFNDGKLYVPKDSRDGEFLTLMMIQ